MQLRHISPRSIDWVDAMDEGSGGRGWEKLGPEERDKLRHQVQYRGRDVERADEAQATESPPQEHQRL
jgi:hypothetical protein